MWIKSLWNSNPRLSAELNNVVFPDHQIAEAYYITGRRNDDDNDDDDDDDVDDDDDFFFLINS